MSHKIAYWLAMTMIVVATFILRFHFEIKDVWTGIWIINYMVIYGALMAWGTKE